MIYLSIIKSEVIAYHSVGRYIKYECICLCLQACQIRVLCRRLDRSLSASLAAVTSYFMGR